MASTLPYLASPVPSQPRHSDRKKLRSACDSCHQCKVKCSGGSPCFRCTSRGLCCRYGFQNRAGKPKGSKNRKTLEREHRLRLGWLHSLDSSTINLSGQTSLSNPCTDFSSPLDLDPWTMEMDLALQTPPEESSSESLEALTTPVSSFGDDAYLQLSDPATSISPEFPPLQQHPDQGCGCVQSQAVNVAALHQLTGRDRSDRFDLAMKSITATLETCERFIACHACHKSLSSILLTLSATELIFSLSEQLTMNNHPPGALPCSLGNYKVTQEEGQAIRNVLIKITLSRGRQTLDALHNLLNVDSVDSSLGCCEDARPDLEPVLVSGLSVADREYMTLWIRRKRAALDVLMAAVVV
ncbi:hypothetical protein ASPZODRAFT_147127 [Penicilliopsis zonata CBS 506.65]|uniref:Zn(2)-C6 fungal-type domain-containing protein n=1 Tax=Penicilliopsis zonata CBS 506.65 TaxID=1073090 RepID=A0A1L9S6D5_9EURO|nr:hypothetical protein ASPZODRAFT_147127 [Penicilliopsis zonata CBS 506.65]OJJ42726.1 hypothetical protein ASPZODRAFT_147127 [Penicilliopsis zonata CBS 506.65]